MFDFVSIGIREAEQAIVPPQFQELPLLTDLQNIGQVFKLNNRLELIDHEWWARTVRHEGKTR